MGDITVKEMIKSAKQNLDEVSTADVKKKLNSSKTNIIDIRDTAELIENGVIPGSHHASRGHLEFFADPKCEYYKDCFNKEKEIILFCIKYTGLLEVALVSGESWDLIKSSFVSFSTTIAASYALI